MAVISAVAYARYSSDKQQESSITVQLAAIRKFCEAQKIELIHEYVDEAQTGTNANRKDFQEMVKAAPDKQFQLVVVHRMDRWARNVDDARYYKKYFAKFGIKVVSAIEEFDETPEGEFFELMSMGMAELYSKKLSREAKAGKLANARQGKIHGGTPLLGYKVKNKYYVVDEEEAEAVRIIFDMVAQGYGYTAIRNHLNANGYRRADGRLFTAHFSDILRNRKYIGEYVYNRSAYRARGVEYNNHSQKEESEIIRIPGAMPRIIDDETFYKVQRMLDERQKNPKLRGVKKKKYLLSGLIQCGECGRAFHGTKYVSNSIAYAIYRCGKRGMTCPSRTVNALHLEEYINRLFIDCLLKAENIEKFTELIKACYIKAYDKVCDELTESERIIEETENDITLHETALSNDENRVIKSFISDDLYELRVRLDKFLNEKNILREKVSAFPEFSPAKIKKNIKRYSVLFRTDDIKELDRVYKECIKQITITNDIIETSVNLRAFVGDYIPVSLIISEKRDNVARLENHGKRAFTFATIRVKIQ